MIKKVLIATDGSEHARKAVAVGADIAAKHGAEVLLVHVLLRNELSDDLRRMAQIEHLTGEGGKPLSESIASVPPGRFPAYVTFAEESSDTSEDLLRAVGNQVLDQAEDVAVEHGAKKVSKRIEDGKPVDRILDIVKEEKVDLVVTGARGLSDVAALLLGSTSHKLSNLSPVTCLTVR
jgi:nucleotide-binding universal stress UspA family protein